MEITEKNDDSVLVVESPIEFVLIGTLDNRRVIIAKSRLAKIDLLSSRLKKSKDSYISLYQKILNPKVSKKPHFVESVYIKKIGMSRYDNLEFVWRGIASRNDVKIIEDVLNNSVINIYIDINKKNSRSELEWIISELVFVANELGNRTYQRIIKRKIVLLIFMILYMIASIYAILVLFPK